MSNELERPVSQLHDAVAVDDGGDDDDGADADEDVDGIDDGVA